jgi:hypothetical protein
MRPRTGTSTKYHHFRESAAWSTSCRHFRSASRLVDGREATGPSCFCQNSDLRSWDGEVRSCCLPSTPPWGSVILYHYSIWCQRRSLLGGRTDLSCLDSYHDLNLILQTGLGRQPQLLIRLKTTFSTLPVSTGSTGHTIDCVGYQSMYTIYFYRWMRSCFRTLMGSSFCYSQ